MKWIKTKDACYNAEYIYEIGVSYCNEEGCVYMVSAEEPEFREAILDGLTKSEARAAMVQIVADLADDTKSVIHVAK